MASECFRLGNDKSSSLGDVLDISSKLGLATVSKRLLAPPASITRDPANPENSVSGESLMLGEGDRPKVGDEDLISPLLATFLLFRCNGVVSAVVVALSFSSKSGCEVLM